jgi:hypothetical protein
MCIMLTALTVLRQIVIILLFGISSATVGLVGWHFFGELLVHFRSFVFLYLQCIQMLSCAAVVSCLFSDRAAPQNDRKPPLRLASLQ